MMREVWRWSLWFSLAVSGLLVIVDLSFVSANLTKLLEGGWVPLVTASLVYVVMATWHEGRAALIHKLERDTLPLASFIQRMRGKPRLPGTAVYMSRRLDVVPVPMLHNLKHYKMLHERNVILTVETQHVPRVDPEQRLEVNSLGDEFYSIIVHYGFMEHPNIPAALDACLTCAEKLGFNMMDTSFFLARETIVGARKSALDAFRRRIFIWLHRNAQDATQFFRIPPDRMVELGARIEL
jgi:KUP system potassium uptake protein